MSAFYINHETMNRVICGIRATSIPIWTESRPDGVGQLLYSMNMEAIIQRYDPSDGEIADMQAKRDSFKWKPQKGDLFSFLKAIDCLLYQCSEGNVPDSPTFEMLERYRNALADKIIYGDTRYQNADWESK